MIIGLCAFHAGAATYDCFLFLNELDVLDIRLAELDPCVDRFIIVEVCSNF